MSTYLPFIGAQAQNVAWSKPEVLLSGIILGKKVDY